MALAEDEKIVKLESQRQQEDPVYNEDSEELFLDNLDHIFDDDGDEGDDESGYNEDNVEGEDAAKEMLPKIVSIGEGVNRTGGHVGKQHCSDVSNPIENGD